MVLRCVRAGLSPRADFARKAPVAGQDKSQEFCVETARHTSARGATNCALLLIGASLIAVAASDAVRAQDAQLPPLTVEANQKKTSKPKSAAKKAPVAAPAAPAPVASIEAAAKSAPTEASEVPYNTPAGVSVVSEGELNTFGQVRVDDVLRTVPGTYTRESTNNPGIAVNIRGFEGSGRVNMMIDGARQNSRFTGHEAQGFTYVDPMLLGGIEIQRGAVSTAGGAGALAGTANFRTLEVQDILKPGQQAGALTKLNWGSNNLGFSEMGAAAVSNGSVGFAAAISRKKPDDYENGDGILVPFTDQDLHSGLFKGEFNITDEQRLKFGAVLYDNDFLSNSYYQNVNTKTYTANYTYRPIDNQWVDFKLNGYRTEEDMDYDTNAAGGGSAAGRSLHNNGWSFDTSNTSRFALGPVHIRSEYGYEYYFNSVDAFNTRTPASGGGVNPSGKSGGDSLFSSTTFTMGIVDLIAGLRYDTSNLSGSFFAQPGNPQQVPPGLYVLDNTYERWIPKVTLALTPDNPLQPYITYSEAMRAPTIYETMAGGSHPGGGVGFAPNPFLEPEIQKGWEIGANYKTERIFTGRDILRVKGDYYRQDVENYITGCFAGAGVFFCNNPGTSLVQGVEAQGDYDAGFVFASASYTYTDTDLPSQINGFGATSFLPEHIVTLTGGVRLLDEKLTLGARGYITSGAYIGDINAAVGQSPYVDGYELLDLFSKYEVTPDIELGVTVTNVFDLAYTPALNTPGTGFVGDTGRGRTFLLTTRAQF